MKKLITILLAAVLAISCSAVDTASPDPVISQDYLNSVLMPQIQQELSEYAADGLRESYFDFFYQAGQIVAQYNSDLQAAGPGSINGRVRLKEGDLISLPQGGSVTILYGSASVQSPGFTDATQGRAMDSGDYLPQNHNCLAAEAGCTFVILSHTAELSVSGDATVTYSGSVDYNSCASALETLGLFRGDTTGYALERQATRTEGLVMFIRLLGQEDEALAFTGAHPFTDVAEWASPYVAYAYDRGYTNGISDTLFGSDNLIAAGDYMTFLMRALGHTEGTDFNWSSALADSLGLGLINQTEAGMLEAGFYRAQMAYVSYYVLYSPMAGTSTTLLQTLEKDGAVANLVPAACRIVGTRLGQA